MKNVIDHNTCTLHSHVGWEVRFSIEQYEDGTYHAEAEEDESFLDFLETDYPEEVQDYLDLVASIPSKDSRHLDIINQYVARYTYNSIHPFIEDDYGWITLDEEEIDKD